MPETQTRTRTVYDYEYDDDGKITGRTPREEEYEYQINLSK